MSTIYTRDQILVIADELGLDEMSDTVANALASDVEYRLRDVIEEATKFTRHAHRERLTVDDINSALQMRNIEPLFGYDGRKELQYSRAFSASGLYFAADEEVSFTDLITRPFPRPPRELTFSTHWLAVEGVQPAIPQNPAPGVQRASATAVMSAVRAGEGQVKDGSAGSGMDGPATKKRATAVVDSGTGVGGVQAPTVELKMAVEHHIPLELQLYYDKVTAAVTGPHEQMRAAAFESLRKDPGLHQLLPYFTQFVSDQVTEHLRKFDHLRHLMDMVQAIFSNPTMHIEPYLHHLMPPILTCTVGRRLCEHPWQDHWALRDAAASLVALVCRRYGQAYATLQPRITRTLLSAFLDLSMPLTTHYGAIVGLTKLGHNVINATVVPNIKFYVSKLPAAAKVGGAGGVLFHGLIAGSTTGESGSGGNGNGSGNGGSVTESTPGAEAGGAGAGAGGADDMDTGASSNTPDGGVGGGGGDDEMDSASASASTSASASAPTGTGGSVKNGPSAETVFVAEARKCYEALLNAAGLWVRHIQYEVGQLDRTNSADKRTEAAAAADSDAPSASASASASGAKDGDALKQAADALSKRLKAIEALMPGAAALYDEVRETFGDQLTPFMASSRQLTQTMPIL